MHFLVEIFLLSYWDVIRIRFPVSDILVDVFPDPFQFLTISNDVIMVIPLPQAAESAIRVFGDKHLSTSTI